MAKFDIVFPALKNKLSGNSSNGDCVVEKMLTTMG
jgi:hypothetical protein